MLTERPAPRDPERGLYIGGITAGAATLNDLVLEADAVVTLQGWEKRATFVSSFYSNRAAVGINYPILPMAAFQVAGSPNVAVMSLCDIGSCHRGLKSE